MVNFNTKSLARVVHLQFFTLISTYNPMRFKITKASTVEVKNSWNNSEKEHSIMQEILLGSVRSQVPLPPFPTPTHPSPPPSNVDKHIYPEPAVWDSQFSTLLGGEGPSRHFAHNSATSPDIYVPHCRNTVVFYVLFSEKSLLIPNCWTI